MSSAMNSRSYSRDIGKSMSFSGVPASTDKERRTVAAKECAAPLVLSGRVPPNKRRTE